MNGFKRYLHAVWQIFRKDLQVEWRGRQGLPVMLVFALLVVFLFNFALQLTPGLQAGLAAGLLWVSLAFASTLGLNRSVSLERENNALDGLLLAPVDRSAIFFGKALSNLTFTMLVALVLLPVFSLFYQQNMLDLRLVLVVLLGQGAYTSLGTLLAALSIQTRTRWKPAAASWPGSPWRSCNPGSPC
jgi:heme exporter protein B